MYEYMRRQAVAEYNGDMQRGAEDLDDHRREKGYSVRQYYDWLRNQDASVQIRNRNRDDDDDVGRL
jgi:hypothetical protein